MIERVARTASTNSDLLERLRHWPVDVPFAPVLRVAEVQTMGRGRHGRAWHGEAGAALTFSLAWASTRDDLGGLSLAVGVALAEALDGGNPPRIGLKWPNDLVIGDVSGLRKLGGVLIETAPLGPRRAAVIGVGINVLAPRSPALTTAASLDELDAG
ncbi:MAG: biotin--[acetyl-CoA-carboxylase] ligase, partial [Pseudomonadota bacterium]|nr:biotin--[acetyl-CoA-carboxylase] ligase [Pseudomonadota bacterium]